MGKVKHLQLTFHNAMSMTILIDGHEATVRDCPSIAFTQLVSKAIEQHSDKARIEQELADLSFNHTADKWYAVNVLARRGINLAVTDKAKDSIS